MSTVLVVFGHVKSNIEFRLSLVGVRRELTRSRSLNGSVFAGGNRDKGLESMHVIVLRLGKVCGKARIVSSLQSVCLCWLRLHICLMSRVSLLGSVSKLREMTCLLFL